MVDKWVWDEVPLETVNPSNVPHEVLCIGDVYETDTWTPRRDDWLDGTDDYLRR